MKSYKRKATPFVLIAIVILTFSCAKKGIIADIKEAPTTDQCIVFGKLTLMDSGIVKKWGEVLYEKPLLVLLTPTSDVAGAYDIKDDGKFFWALSPGEYSILGFGDRMQGRHNLPTKANFTVPADKKCMYIGDFLLVFQGSRFGYKIENNSQIAISDFKARFPHIEEIPVVDIMKKEIHLGSYESIQHICSFKWGMDCDIEFLGKSFKGVIPINPEATFGRFKTKANSLKPSFEWQPSRQKNLTYDLIIYEATAYYWHTSHMHGSSKTYIPGRFVLLKEDIKEPNYTLATELKPGTNYFWSVRLREDNKVSTWSKFNYRYYFVIGATWGSGQWFTFSTPKSN